MPRYHLNILNGSGAIPDEPGQELDDLDAARRQAILGIRSILSSEVQDGYLDLRGQIEITDLAGRLLATVPYGDAVELRLPDLPA